MQININEEMQKNCNRKVRQLQIIALQCSEEEIGHRNRTWQDDQLK